MEKLKEYRDFGVSIGLDGKELQDFITKQQEIEREERAAVREHERRKCEIDLKLKELTIAEEDNHSNGNQTSSLVKLPKLELPKFNGKRGTWTAFWNVFEINIHQSDLPDVTKFSYLKRQVTGDAAKVIDGLQLVAEHYEEAVELLHKRYGKKQRLIFEHMQDLLDLPALAEDAKLQELQQLVDSVWMHVRSLEKLGITSNMYGVFLTPLVLSKLPTATCLEWARDSADKESDLEYLLYFLDVEVDRKTRCEMFVEESGLQTRLAVQNSTAAQFFTNRKEGAPKCAIHNSASHRIEDCQAFRQMPLQDRHSKTRELRLCLNCLVPGHRAYECRKGQACSVCQIGGHHPLLCYKSENQKTSQGPAPNSVSRNESIEPTQDKHETPTDQEKKQANAGFAAISHQDQDKPSGSSLVAVLPTAKVSLGGRTFTLLMDTGSDRSYVSKKVIESVRPKWLRSTTSSYQAFGGVHTKQETRNIYELDFDVRKVQAIEVDKISHPLQRIAVPSDTMKKLNIVPADDYTLDRSIQIDIIIGLDYYWKVMEVGTPPIVVDNLVAQKSAFGWIVSGSLDHRAAKQSSSLTMFVHNTPEASFEQVVRNQWELEALGVTPVEKSHDSKVHEQFLSNGLRYVESESRYEVSLTWKQDTTVALVNNYHRASEHAKRLHKKLERLPEIASAYQDYFQDLEDSGMVVEVPSHQLLDPTAHYLHHRPVVRDSSSSTKVRPVFNASLPGPNGVALNDCLEKGPSLIPLVPPIIMRFRRWPIALNADIQKAFLQIKLAQEDQEVHRFLLVNKDGQRVLKFCRLTFGISCSPFILNAVIKHHLAQYEMTPVIRELLENLYVDDWLTGANQPNEVVHLHDEAIKIMHDAGMHLTKWNTNSALISSEFPVETTAICDVVKVLGVAWHKVSDTIQFPTLAVIPDIVPTKRIILSLEARIFDPLGFLLPFLMSVKILFQECWKLGLPWDDVLPPDLYDQALQWINDLTIIESIKITRAYHSQTPWSTDQVELHVFCDASERGYGCVVYLTVPGREPTFVFARARVAPLEKQTLPRLELLACLLGSQCYEVVANALYLTNSVYKCYSDSTIALAWIKSDAKQWKAWIHNRVVRIQAATEPRCWFHVPGLQNPADLLTRGIRAEELANSSLWLHGPTDIGQLSTLDSTASESPGSTQIDEEQEDAVFLDIPHDPVDKFWERIGSYPRVVRVMAWVVRFTNNMRKLPTERKVMDLSVLEIQYAEKLLVKQVQLDQFSTEIETLKAGKALNRSSKLCQLSPRLDESGILRKSNRTEFAAVNKNSVYPIILPKGHFARIFTRFIHNLFCHIGVDSILTVITRSYWIIGLRTIAKNVKKSCISCQKIDAAAYNEIAAPLPRERVIKAPPFSVCGVDFAGPFYCSDFADKLYVCLFTCAVTRAVHIQLTHDQSQDTFLLAVRDMAARRGRPKVFYSDNAKAFQGAAQVLQRYFGPLAPEWRFIAPRSPWWGGWWERLVRSTKSALKKTIGKRLLTRTELETTLHEVEFCINSRPLTFVGDTPDYERPLTPNHFLLGGLPGFDQLEEDVPITPQVLGEREKLRLELLDDYWNAWSNSYLRNLPTCVAKFNHKGTIKVGDVVLLHEDAPTPRLKWPLGVVTELYYGRDGVCRLVDVRTKSGIRKRDIRRLYNLELNSHIMPDDKQDYESDEDSDQVADDDINVDNQNDSETEHISDDDSAVDTTRPDQIDSQSPYVTRTGRISRAPKVLDI